MSEVKLPRQDLNWPIAWPGVVLIAEIEKCRLTAYKPTPDDRWTCGWGETDGVGPNTQWDQNFADQRFCDSLTHYTEEVKDACTVVPNENQLAAMVSLAYNIGLGWKGKKQPKGAKKGFRQSTVLQRHNEGKTDDAASAFGLWNMQAGKVLTGLVRRRAAEKTLYLTPPAGSYEPPAPQSVDPETSLAKSPITQGGATTLGAGIVTMLGAVGDQVSTLKTVLGNMKSFIAETLGVPPGWVLPLVLMGVGVVVMRYRYIQRKTGHA